MIDEYDNKLIKTSTKYKRLYTKSYGCWEKQIHDINWYKWMYQSNQCTH